MGLLGRIKRSFAPSLEERIKGEASEQIETLRKLAASGASKEEMGAVFNELLRSQEFYQVLGELKNSAPSAIGLSIMKLDKSQVVDEEVFRDCWNRYYKAQEDAISFFGDSVMSSWVTARALREKYERMSWAQIDACLCENDAWGEIFRSEDWWRVPWSFAVADEVQDREGAGSCDAKKFSAMWEEMASGQTIKKFLETLTTEQILYYKCMD